MKKKILLLLNSLFLAVLLCFPAYADGLSGLPIVTGTKELLKDATPIIVVIGIAVSGVLGGWRIIQWQAADEQEKPRAKKKIWETVGGAILITCFVGSLTAILGYYGGGMS